MSTAHDDGQWPTPRHANSTFTSTGVATSNLTTSHFLGANQRSWMRPGYSNSTTTNSPAVPQHTRQTDNSSATTNLASHDIAQTSDHDGPPQSLHASLVSAPYNKQLPAYSFVSAVPEAATHHEVPVPQSHEAERQVQESDVETITVSDSRQSPTERRNPEGAVSVQAQIEVVDLTTSHSGHNTQPSQEVQEQQEPGSSVPTVGSSQIPTAQPAWTTHSPPKSQISNHTSGVPRNSASIARPQSLNREFLEQPQNTFARPPSPNMVAHPTSSGPGSGIPTRFAQSSADAVNSVQHSSSVHATRHPTGQLLTPAASPITPFTQIDTLTSQLQRKRPRDVAEGIQQPPPVRPHLPQQPIDVQFPHLSAPARRSSSHNQRTPTQQSAAFVMPCQSYQQPLQPSFPIPIGPQYPAVGPPLPASTLNQFQRANAQPQHVPINSVPSNGYRQIVPIAPSGPTLSRGESYLAHFESMVASMNSRVSFSHQPDQSIIPWLVEACKQNDLFYLLLSQLFCTWHTNKVVLETLGVGVDCDAGFLVLERLFGLHSTLPSELVAFLASWPNSVSSLRTSPELRRGITSIATFLPRLGLIWDAFRSMCVRRGYPPLAREILEYIRCPPCIILPRAIFGSILSQMKISDLPAPFATAAHELFNTQQQVYYAIIYRGDNLPPLEVQVAAFAQSYSSLLGRYLPHRAALQQGLPSQTYPDGPLPHETGSLPQVSNVQSIFPPQPNINRTNIPLPQTATLATEPRLSRPGTNSAQLPSQPSRLHHRQVSQAAPPATSPQIQSGQSGNRRTAAASSTTPATYVDGPGPIQAQYMETQRVPITQNGQGPSLQAYQRSTSQAQQPSIAAVHMPPRPSVQSTQPTGSSDLAIGFLAGNHFQVLRTNVQMVGPAPILPDLRQLPPFLTNPDPNEQSLHQAHLRQPKAVLKNSTGNTITRLYQFIDSCVLVPYIFAPDVSFFSVNFDISQDIFDRAAKIIQPAENSFAIPQRILSTESIVMNLRCVRLSGPNESVWEHEWAALPTYWPQHIFVSFNATHLDIRRKRNYGRDMPIDVTPFIEAGQNNIKISIHTDKADTGKHFAIAVEVVVMRDAAQVGSIVRTISSKEALESITKSLQSTTNGDDDEMQVVNDSLILSVTDPFLSSMFIKPVRGEHCLHRECFDLDTFLQTRISDCQDALTSVYQWRCPICNKDARPSSLIIDGFLQEIRNKLVADGDTEARAVIVKADGSWTVKPEEENGSKGRIQGQRTPAKTETRLLVNGGGTATVVSRQVSENSIATQAPPPPAQVIEIIELDDD